MDAMTGRGRAAVLETHLDLPLFSRGKVRDNYDLGDRLLLVATDRLSAFDCVLATGIPDRGRVRSEERRVGKECPSKCRSRWSPYH